MLFRQINKHFVHWCHTGDSERVLTLFTSVSACARYKLPHFRSVSNMLIKARNDCLVARISSSVPLTMDGILWRCDIEGNCIQLQTGNCASRSSIRAFVSNTNLSYNFTNTMDSICRTWYWNQWTSGVYNLLTSLPKFIYVRNRNKLNFNKNIQNKFNLNFIICARDWPLSISILRSHWAADLF